MANAYRVRQYFQKSDGASDITEFSSIDSAKTDVGLSATHLSSGSPTVTYSTSNQNGDSGPFYELVVTYEFASEADQTTWYNAMESANWFTGSNIYYSKVEWLNEDGSVSATRNYP